MPSEHELQLMLVNSIRKVCFIGIALSHMLDIIQDLEDSSVSRICLALDTLIQSPSRDVIPAVQSRLHDLLSHQSSVLPYVPSYFSSILDLLHRSNVKRRALLAFHKLSELDPEVLRSIVNKTGKRLKDPDPVVVSAALILGNALLEVRDT